MSAMKKQISFTLNGKKIDTSVDIRKSLLEFLREDLQLTGTKQGCSVGECGACTAIVDGEIIDSCIYLAVWADGRDITTIEGIGPEGIDSEVIGSEGRSSNDGNLSEIQQSFIDAGAVQCGFCMPGMVLSASALLNKNPHPTREEIRRGMSGNLCRCTGYKKIVDAVENVSK